jgi:hypothetical protein
MRYLETELCRKGILTDSLKISICKSCLEVNYTKAICPICGIKNWIGTDFLNNKNSIRKIETKWNIPHGEFINHYKYKKAVFKLNTIRDFIKKIIKEE